MHEQCGVRQGHGRGGIDGKDWLLCWPQLCHNGFLNLQVHAATHPPKPGPDCCLDSRQPCNHQPYSTILNHTPAPLNVTNPSSIPPPAGFVKSPSTSGIISASCGALSALSVLRPPPGRTAARPALTSLCPQGCPGSGGRSGLTALSGRVWGTWAGCGRGCPEPAPRQAGAGGRSRHCGA